MNPIVLIPPAGLSDSNPYKIRVDSNPMNSRIYPVASPEIHSKQVYGRNFMQIAPISYLKLGLLVLTTYLAYFSPKADLRSSA